MKRRTPAQIGFDAVRQRGAELAAKAYLSAALTTEDEIADEAVRLQKETEAELKNR